MKVVTKGLLILALLGGVLAGPVRAAEKPLTVDDVTLLLLGGANTDKMLSLINQRGIDFHMNPDLAKKFHDAGADDMVIEALQKAPEKAPTAPAAANIPQPSTAPQSSAPPAPAPTANSPAPSAASTPTVTAEPSPKPKGVPLPDPSPADIQRIIQEFAAKEKVFKEARNNYTAQASSARGTGMVKS